ncbi:MAG: hypothetical protein CR985_02535 [Flavobacteriales bacterium]|nr:MAG: hypothetical protein CR985_02535 [Flavobacteriales bacterium]
MDKKIIVYTAIFGKYSGLIKQPKYKNVEYICYTDQNLKSNIWKIIKVKPPVKNDATRSNRFYKLLPHRHLSNYDISVYIDGNILITKDITNLVFDILKNNSFGCFDHNQNAADPRNCIYKEYEAILELGKVKKFYKDNPEVMRKQIERFRKEGYPENNGLITAPILIRKHNNKKLIEVMEAWWKIVKNESKRDQLSFNYVAWKLNFTDFKLIDGDVRHGNPWFYTISHRKNYSFKIFKLKFKKFFKKN